MIGLVVVSHSEKLAEGVVELAKQMTLGQNVPIIPAGGLENGDIGTSFDKIMEAIKKAYSEDGVLVLMDLGSAVMTTQTCLDFLPPEMQSKVLLCNAPIVEGSIAAASAAAQGFSIEKVKEIAENVNTSKVQEDFSEEETAFSEKAKVVDVKLINPTGLHARPASLFVQLASKFKSEIKVQNITAGKKPADAKSIMDMAVNGTGEKGDIIRIIAEGEDAEEAIKELKELVESGFGELDSTTEKINFKFQKSDSHVHDLIEEKPVEKTNKKSFKGTPVCPGYAVAPAWVYKREVLKTSKKKEGKFITYDELLKVIEKVSAETKVIKEKLVKNGDSKVAAIFEFHEMILNDEKMKVEIKNLVSDGLSADEAFVKVINSWIDKLENQEFELMKERAKDLEDIKNRVLLILFEKEGQSISPAEKSILLIDELLPSETAILDKDKVIGIATAYGGTTSHAAIIARMLGIPSIVGLGAEILNIPSGTLVALDSVNGVLLVNPNEKVVEEFMEKNSLLKLKEKELIDKAKELSKTKDGRRIEVFANVGKIDGLEEIKKFGAEGIGLLRTEFMYVDKKKAPTEEEQFSNYSLVSKIMKEKPVVIRTLDIGGDKPLEYISLDAEDNPFLGVRAIRLYKKHPELFKTQIKAILRANQGNLKLMLPMISSIDEVRWAKKIIDECKTELLSKSIKFNPEIEIGIMIEIPSAALMSEILAKEVDFFSIGTNDLTQYTLAVDRGNKNLGYLFDSLEPSILRLIKITVDNAHKYGRLVSVCGEVASEKEAIPILIGLGVDELSMNPRMIPYAKELIRTLSYQEVRDLALKTLNMENASQVREFISKNCNI